MSSFEEQAVAFLQGKWKVHDKILGKKYHVELTAHTWRMREVGNAFTAIGTWTFYQINPEEAPRYGGMGYAMTLTADDYSFGATEHVASTITDIIGAFGPGAWDKLYAMGGKLAWKMFHNEAKRGIKEGTYNRYFVVHNWDDGNIVVMADTTYLKPEWVWRRA